MLIDYIPDINPQAVHAKFIVRYLDILGHLKGLEPRIRHKEIYKLCEHDFKLFVYYFCLNWFYGEAGYLHNYIFDTVQAINSTTKKDNGILTRDKQFKLNIIAPRGNAKSSLITICWTIWDILYKREKNILMLTNSIDKAKSNLKNIRNMLMSSEIKQVYNPQIKVSQSQFMSVNGISIFSRSIGQDVRGINEDGVRITRVIFDDLESEEMAASHTMRESNWTNWTDAIEPTQTPPNYPIQTIFIGVNTALHPDCICMRLAKERQDYDSINFKAIISEPTNPKLWSQYWDKYLIDKNDSEIFYTQNKKQLLDGVIVNWADAEPYKSLYELRQLKGLRTFEREKQGNPLDLENLNFTRYMLDDKGLINPKVLFNLDTIPSNLHIHAHLDPAMGKSRTKGDYSCLVIIGVDNDYKHYILDAQLMRIPPEEQVSKIISTMSSWGCKNLNIEAVSAQGLWLPLIQGSNANININQVRALASTSAGNDKLEAIDNTLIHFGFSHNKLFFNQNLPQEFFDQFIQFPSAAHDDAPDAVASLLWYWHGSKSSNDSNYAQKVLDKR